MKINDQLSFVVFVHVPSEFCIKFDKFKCKKRVRTIINNYLTFNFSSYNSKQRCCFAP